MKIKKCPICLKKLVYQSLTQTQEIHKSNVAKYGQKAAGTDPTGGVWYCTHCGYELHLSREG